MKTLNEIHFLIEEQILIFDNEKNLKTKKKIYDKVMFLRFVFIYLETNPNPNFLLKTRNDINQRISKLKDNYQYWSANVCDKGVEIKNRKSMFFRNTEINELNKRIKTLNFILD